MNYSLYFQAKIKKEFGWLVTSSLRYAEYVAFDRAVDHEQDIFEFFVAPDLCDVFLDVMNKLAEKGIVSHLEQLPNRFAVVKK
ncbi:hypothetical protein HYV11_01540 [Candidatus Dependentiae bacterium]|nr:hypothetical protein [Candidatus Dependentiae bacterium]